MGFAGPEPLAVSAAKPVAIVATQIESKRMEVTVNRVKGKSPLKRGSLGPALLFPSGGEIGQAGGFAGGEMVGFAKVRGEVVELPSSGLVACGFAQEFLITLAQGGLVAVGSRQWRSVAILAVFSSAFSFGGDDKEFHGRELVFAASHRLFSCNEVWQ